MITLKNNIEELKNYIENNPQLKNNFILTTIVEKINDYFKINFDNQDLIKDKIKKDFNIKSEHQLNQIMKDMEGTSNLSESDINTFILHRFISGCTYNYFNDLPYGTEYKDDKFDIKVDNGSLIISTPLSINEVWTINKLLKYFKSYYTKNSPSSKITIIILNGKKIDVLF